MGYRVGIDVGGTFTDLVAVNTATGDITSVKTATISGDPAAGVINGIIKLAIEPCQITEVIHGSTMDLNMLINGGAGGVGLICTRGFSDILEIRRVWREKMIDLSWNRPKSLLPRRLCVGVKERIDWRGKVITPLDEQSVVKQVQYLKGKGVISYAVSLLFSFLNPVHEQRLKTIIQQVHPGALTTLSSEVLPEIREYERTSTTVISAILKPVMTTYINDLRIRLKSFGVVAPLKLLKSNGGIDDFAHVLMKPMDNFASGSVGGVVASLNLGKEIKAPNLITFDMGGTTTDVGLIRDYQPLYAMERDIKWDIPIRGLMFDIKSIGSGGGSIAAIDQGGGIRVGPESVGAFPGPACYNQGGEVPTITDANVILGRIGSQNFLGGEKPLHAGLAQKAMRKKLGRFLQKSEEDAASYIDQISLSNMAQLVREATIGCGYDPRDFKLVSYGGAGALYAAELAEELGISEVIIPCHAGVFSAMGGIYADIVHDFVQSYYVAVEKIDQDVFNNLVGRLKNQALNTIAGKKVKSYSINIFIDLRYTGEIFEITVLLDFNNGITRQSIADAIREFHLEHERRYGFDRPDEPVELVNVRLKMIIPQLDDTPSWKGLNDTDYKKAIKGYREVYFRSSFAFMTIPVYERKLLGVGIEVAGPAIIEEPETTVVVPPDFKFRIDVHGNILIGKSQLQEMEHADGLTAKIKQLERYAYIKPVVLDVMGSEFLSICREMGTAMVRTAYSPIFVDGMDFACGIFDSTAELVAVANYCPVHLAAMALAPEWAVMELGLDSLKPGDVVILNDPFRGGTHITDFTVIKPIFYYGELVAMAANRAHHLDVGGKAAGGFPGDATDIYQEGICVPPVRWFKEGIENTDFVETLFSNVRLPWVQVGDMRAQLHSVLTAERRILQLIDKYGLVAVKQSMQQLKNRSEQWLRKEIAAIPDGTYSFEDFIDDDGVCHRPYSIKVTIKINGSDLVMDFTGSSPQALGPVNAVYGVTAGSCFNALMQVTNPRIPFNRGCFRPVKIIAPRGSIVNPTRPAATFGGNTDTNIRIIDVVIGAFARVLPRRVRAASYGTCNNFTGGGYDNIRQQPFVFYFFNEGGWGASNCQDGWNATFNPIGNCRNISAEIIESNYPLRYEQVALNEGSAGAGEFRGGFGTKRVLTVLSDQMEVNALGERHRFKPYGLFGGLPAQANAFLVKRYNFDKEESFAATFYVKSPSKFSKITLFKGDTFYIINSGGGGYGDPVKRKPEKVLEDVEDGLISTTQARDEYGVVFVKVGGVLSIDDDATARHRKEMTIFCGDGAVTDIIVSQCQLAARLGRRVWNEDNAYKNETKRKIDLLMGDLAHLSKSFCEVRCRYRFKQKQCILFNDEVMSFWSPEAINRWLGKHCILKLKL
ncbi:oxoprolinase family protein [Desulfoscipio gibsoniae]|uniref:N-methylhydantoinase B/acetone carboxylase, alpha subunit n=1 Tax=Desulfoscipio gibsoniae DSM 7213 TaxID=767817 RepID=R4KRH4_9FIRM|nr:oxoprolinase family protein [Desulfoscipio gibsoniae]AGL02211.1 N-methylhydantoinase B/acetone carboxylase, alpha subunit [Desulfoscipio gibsoniae DSM 7213]